MYLPRIIEKAVKDGAKEFPVVAVMGPRQVGKSTLLQHLFSQSHAYITFDDLSQRNQAETDPHLFIRNNPGDLILDEIQYVPNLLPELKIEIDKNQKPGRFILTGSQQFHLIKGMQESLAGRVLILNLYPMTMLEKSGQGKEKSWLYHLLTKGNPRYKKNKPYTQTTPVKSLWQGGLPGLLKKSEKFYQPFFSSYIKTFLERDLPAQFSTGSPAQLMKFIELLAPLTSQEINKSQLGREINISPPTAQRWLHWLNVLQVYKEVPPLVGNLIKRISKHPKGCLFDTGIISHLLHISSPKTLESHPALSHLFEAAIRMELQAICESYLLPAYIYHWRTPYGHEVDIVIEYENYYFAFEVKWSSQPKENDIKGLLKFKSEYKDKVKFLGIITPVGQIREIYDGIFQIPWIESKV